jgi:hypothetical protein
MGEITIRQAHGVEFFHDKLSGQSDRTPVAFLEKYGWREGGPATVRLLGTRPSAITAAHWPEIIEGHSPKTNCRNGCPSQGLRKTVRKEILKFGLGSWVQSHRASS